MAFILSKVLLFLFEPFLWVLALVAAGLLIKKPLLKKRLFVAAAVVLLVFSNPFLLNRVAAWWDYGRPHLNTAKTYSCAIVLGGFVSEDAQGNGFFNSSSDRFIEGLRLQASGKVSHLLITGGNASLMPDKFTEGGWVRNELKTLHVSDSAVLIEEHARNTVENARYSKQLLMQRHLQPPYLLVTSAFHMRRALAVFEKEKLPVIPYTSDFGSSAGKITVDDFIPAAGALSGWTRYFKEMVGICIIRYKS